MQNLTCGIKDLNYSFIFLVTAHEWMIWTLEGIKSYDLRSSHITGCWYQCVRVCAGEGAVNSHSCNLLLQGGRATCYQLLQCCVEKGGASQAGTLLDIHWDRPSKRLVVVQMLCSDANSVVITIRLISLKEVT